MLSNMDSSPPPEGRGAIDAKPKSTVRNRVLRRGRRMRSCFECHQRKLKCNMSHPCSNCTRFSRNCLYQASGLRSVSQQRRNKRRTSADLPGGENSSSDNEAAVPEDENGLEPTPLADIDAYEANDDVLDLGIRIGKMRLTERLGGFFRPRLHEEMDIILSEPTNDRRTPDEKRSAIPQLPDHNSDFLAPGPSYIAPGSGFLFGDVGSKRPLINFLPAKAAADILVRNYFENVHFIARVVHWPSFQLHYDNFWTTVLAGLEPPAWQQSIVLSVLFSAVASMPESE
ncbi:uncharacterized protein PV07_12749, partial [Cladophialophora immunda]